MGTELLTEPAPQATGHVCADCANELAHGEEIWLLSVAEPHRFGGRTYYHPIIDPNDPQGALLFSSHFFCFSCWEAMYDSFREEIADEPPVPDDPSMFECICCSSGIREGEYAGALTLGEFRPSRRSPNGVPSQGFAENSPPEPICLHCLTLLNEGHIEMWDALSQSGECTDCIQARCWREEPGSCGCGCHTGTLEEETDELDDGES